MFFAEFGMIFLEPCVTNTNQNSVQYFGQYNELNVDLWGYVKL